MRPLSGFRYIRVQSLAEAWEAMTSSPPGAKFLAGGTDLIVKLKKGLIRSPLLIGLKGIPGWDRIREEEDRILIGACTTVQELLRSPLIIERCPLLSLAAGALGSKQIRNLATIGGNLCNASPAGDLSVALLGLKATVRIEGPQGGRTERLEDFFRQPGVSSLRGDEILTAVSIPSHGGEWRWNYQKLTNRRAMEIGTVNVALGIRQSGTICREGRIALGAVAPKPIRAKEAESLLAGKELDSSLIAGAARLGAELCRPIDDLRGSAAYRREMVANLIRRGLKALEVDSRG